MNNSLIEDNVKEHIDIVAPNVGRVPIGIVNVYFLKYESSLSDKWILVDAGMGNCSKKIIRKAEEFMHSSKAPEAIVLTHGHFDHIGALKKLVDIWNVPVYAHMKEFPYLTGKSYYPPPDPTVGGGAMSLLSFIYPSSPIDLGDKIKAIPENGIIPELPDWKVIETPGHAPGHISLFRESDKTLIAGDAFVTVKQESALSVFKQKQELHGPPAYFTCDWEAAKASVIKLAALEPEIAATGHGLPMRGAELKKGLSKLANNFDALGKPSFGRYIKEPALTNEEGVSYLPPAPIKKGTVATILLGTLASLLVFAYLSNDDDN